jgi:FdhD protein
MVEREETAMNKRVAIAAIKRLGDREPRTDQDLVAVESPLTLTVTHPSFQDVRPLGVLMRTPGDDENLVLGLLHAEGIVRTMADVLSVEIDAATDSSRDDGATARVALAGTVEPGVLPDGRALLTTSACGLCGRLSVHALDRVHGRRDRELQLSAADLSSLTSRLRSGQAIFAETGGLHAAALFDRAGEEVALAEDVGRHNAVDKVVGAALRAGKLPLAGGVLVVSGRVAFEIVQKAVMAGVAAIVAIGAPSSLAVEAARAAGLTLVGFARDGHCNVYVEEVTSLSATASTPPAPPDRRR